MKQQRMSSDPKIPTTPRVKNVKAIPKERKDSWSMSLCANVNSHSGYCKCIDILALFSEAQNLPRDVANDNPEDAG